MHPVHEVALEAGGLGVAVGLVVGVHLFRILALAPWEDGLLGRAEALVLEIVLDVALTADQSALLVARQGLEVLALGLEVVLQGHGVEAQLHVGRVVAVGAADGVFIHVDFFAELVEILGPELVAVFADPVVHLGALAVPAGGGQAGLLVVAIQAVDVQDVLHGVGVPAGGLVFVAEGIAEPEVLQVRLGVLVAFRQGVDVVMLVVGHGAAVFGHDLRFVVAQVGFVMQRELGLEGRVPDFVGFELGLEFRGLGLGDIGTGGQRQGHAHGQHDEKCSGATNRRRSFWLRGFSECGERDGGSPCRTSCSA
ncbi:hypothetical protein DSECCO2_564640 [anaerobic digester metagenome]